jgi:hypothetical protein
MYLDLASTWKGNSLWMHYLTRKDAYDKIHELSEEEMVELLQNERNRFHGFCLLMTSNVTNNRGQLFYHSLALKFHGLSRMGNDMLAQIGFSMKPSSFDTAQKGMLDKAKTQIR